MNKKEEKTKPKMIKRKKNKNEGRSKRNRHYKSNTRDLKVKILFF